MQPELAREVRQWLERALENLREAEHDLSASPPLVRGALFHCQQTAEKAIKAFLTAHERPFRKTHDLEELGREAAALDPTLSTVLDKAVDLTPYAWRFRYPGPPDAPAESEATVALACACEVCEAILARLPEEARP